MSTPNLVADFYRRIWNDGDLAAAETLLADDFAFRGSLGIEKRGRDEFLKYVRSVRAALSDYHCEILTCVTESDQAFAQMRFSGRHAGTFLGYPATGKAVHWLGAALFRVNDGVIAQLWVLGDLKGLDAVLQANQSR
jgi:steroid delta-isomerase-like uncharacterized protein